MKKTVIILSIIALMTSAFLMPVYADTSTAPGQLTKEEKQAERSEKWVANKTRIEEKKAELAARKEAFFALKEQTKDQVQEQKALIKEQKQCIIEQVHLINEMDPEEKEALKADIKNLWQEVRDTQRYLWEVRQAAGEQSRDIVGNVDVVETDVDDVPDVNSIIDDL